MSKGQMCHIMLILTCADVKFSSPPAFAVLKPVAVTELTVSGSSKAVNILGPDCCEKKSHIFFESELSRQICIMDIFIFSGASHITRIASPQMPVVNKRW